MMEQSTDCGQTANRCFSTLNILVPEIIVLTSIGPHGIKPERALDHHVEIFNQSRKMSILLCCEK